MTLHGATTIETHICFEIGEFVGSLTSMGMFQAM